MTPDSSAFLLLGGATRKAALFVFLFICLFILLLNSALSCISRAVGRGVQSPTAAQEYAALVCLSSVLLRKITFAF